MFSRGYIEGSRSSSLSAYNEPPTRSRMVWLDVTSLHHNTHTLSQLSPGDLIEFPLWTFSHWGVYLGDGYVAHQVQEQDDRIRAKHFLAVFGVMFPKTRIRINNFWDIAGNYKAWKKNDTDKKMRPLHPEEIIKNATSKLGEVKYNLIYYNCEHFAKWCRYGRRQSDQVENAVVALAVAVAVILILVACVLNNYMAGETVGE